MYSNILPPGAVAKAQPQPSGDWLDHAIGAEVAAFYEAQGPPSNTYCLHKRTCSSQVGRQVTPATSNIANLSALFSVPRCACAAFQTTRYQRYGVPRDAQTIKAFSKRSADGARS